MRDIVEIPSIIRRLGSPVFLYLAISIIIHNQLLITKTIVVDELFHIPQGLAYCSHQFDQWEAEITTLPGLYIISTLLCNTTFNCTISCLRLTNIFASIVNIFLFYKVARQITPTMKGYVHNALNLAMFPPLFFFSQVYYAEVLSLTMVLALMYTSLRGKSFWATFFGFWAILMRQTNAIYVFMFGGIRIMGLFYTFCFKEHRFVHGDYYVREKDILDFIKRKDRRQRFITACAHLPVWVVFEISSLVTLGLAFAAFIYINGGIIVGDNGAHAPKLHIAQLYYFSLFTVFFAWPFFLKSIVPFCQIIFRNAKSFTIWFICVHILFFLYFVTRTTHPLADNRHYMYYVWNLFLATEIHHYLLSPFISFSLLAMYDQIYRRADIRFFLFYFIALILVLCFQSLVDIRYFIVPFIILRLQTRVTKFELYLETAFYIFINIVTLYIFFTKEIIWSNFAEVQRIIW